MHYDSNIRSSIPGGVGDMQENGVGRAPGAGYGPPWIADDEYLASLRDIPDDVLDAAPDDIPEEVWLAAMEAEAARMPDPLSDPPGVTLAGSLADTADIECSDGALIDRITGFER